jgi:hypothetical protein
MLAICFQERELFVGTFANFVWKSGIQFPESDGSPVMHKPLERADAPFFLVFQRAVNGGVKTTGGEVSGQTCIDALRVILVQPEAELLDFCRTQRLDRAFNFFDGVRSHVYLQDQLSYLSCTQTSHGAL